jgi:hypothetical protein
VPLRDASGNIVKWYGAAADIEDRKRIEQQQQLSKERRDREKSRPPKSSPNLPPIYDENFARRAGQIIASALAAAGAKRK